MILTMAGTAFAGPHGGGSRHGGRGGFHFSSGPRHGGEHFNHGPRPGFGTAHTNRRPHPKIAAPHINHREHPVAAVPPAEAPHHGGGTYIEESSYSDSSYSGNDTASLVITILNNIIGEFSQSRANSNYAVQTAEEEYAANEN